MNKEIAHYVVTAHPPGGVLMTAKCNFMSEYSVDVLVAKNRRIEVRQLRTTSSTDGVSAGAEEKSAAAAAAALPSPFPVVLQIPINGRLTSLLPLKLPNASKSLIFFTTDRLRYAVISHEQHQQQHNPYPIYTHASGSLKGGNNMADDFAANQDDAILGRQVDTGPLICVDKFCRCVALHVFEGLITILPIHTQYTHTSKAAAPLKGGGDGSQPRRQQQQQQQVLGNAFHCRIEETAVLAMEFLLSDDPNALPQLCVLHQDARGAQHLISHVVSIPKQQLHLFGSPQVTQSVEWLKKTSLDGGSSLLIPVAPPSPAVAAASLHASNKHNGGGGSSSSNSGGVIVLGQRQFTYVSTSVTKVLPVPQALFLSFELLPPDPSGMPRYLLGDEFGNLHILTLCCVHEKVVALQFDTLGSCTISTCVSYLGEGLVFVGSQLGDSQLVQIHDEPISAVELGGGGGGGGGGDDHTDVAAAAEDGMDLAETTYLTVIEEYTHLGPILDFDLVPTTPGGNTTSEMGQSQVVTASGSSKSGSLRLIRNGIGMMEYASVEIPGIQQMFCVRKQFSDKQDAYLVQSFVGETRVLGVTTIEEDDDDDEAMEEEESEVGGTLEEVELPGLVSTSSTLYVGNVQGDDLIVQITSSEIRLFGASTGQVHDTYAALITVATANEAGQIAIASRGGAVTYLEITTDKKITKVAQQQMDREVSCLDIHPFASTSSMAMPAYRASSTSSIAMEVEPTDNDDGRSKLLAVGLWDDFTVRLLTLESSLKEALCISLGADDDEEDDNNNQENVQQRRNRHNMMARSLSLITLDFSSNNANHPGVDMLFVGLGDGTLISFAVGAIDDKGKLSVRSKKEVCLGTQRVDLIPLTTDGGGTCVLATGDRPTVIYLAGVGAGTATSGATSQLFNPKLCYSNVNLSTSEEEHQGDGISRPPSQQAIAVNVAAPFYSPLLFDVGALGNQHYTLCVADDSNLRLGVIDDIQKLHVTTCRLGMAPRRIVHCSDGRLFAVGCIESGIKHFGISEEANMGNCIRFMDDTTFDDLERVDLEPFEMILSMCYVTLKVPLDNTEEQQQYKPFLLVGTAYCLPDEDEPTRGRILVYSFEDAAATGGGARVVRHVAELSTQGGVYSMCQFYQGRVLCTVNTKTHVYQLVEDVGFCKLAFCGAGHHGHILSLHAKSRAKRMIYQQPAAAVLDDQKPAAAAAATATTTTDKATTTKTEQQQQDDDEEQLAIIGDLMRSISLVQYYPQHDTLEEIARDFNSNWMTAIEMLNAHVYLGAENWNNLFCLRRNTAAQSEEVRCRLDTIGEYHLGEMCNKFMSGSLVMPVSTTNNSKQQQRRSPPPQRKKSISTGSSSSPSSKNNPRSSMTRRPVVVTGSQTLFGTVDGTLGVVLGLDGRTAAFFATLERCMAMVITPVGNLSHSSYRAIQTEHRIHPAHGFVDGDLVESFLDLDRTTMQAVLDQMNRDGGWEVDDAILRNNSNRNSSEEHMEEDRAAELTVDDVVAMVEEISMMH